MNDLNIEYHTQAIQIARKITEEIIIKYMCFEHPYFENKFSALFYIQLEKGGHDTNEDSNLQYYTSLRNEFWDVNVSNHRKLKLRFQTFFYFFDVCDFNNKFKINLIINI